MNEDDSEKNKNNTLALIVALLIVLVFGYALYASSKNPNSALNSAINNNDIEYLDEEISENPDTGVTAADILNNPELYEGTTVTVRAEVEEWLNPRAVQLDAAGIVNDNLLVITNSPQLAYEDPEVFGDAIWEARGTVKQFNIAIVTDTLDVDLQPDVFSVYESKPYIEAERFELFED